MSILLVQWKDHYLLEGWYTKDQLPFNIHINTSVGFLIKKNKDFILLGMTHHSNEEIFGDVLYILKKDIVSITELNTLGEQASDEQAYY